MILAGQDTTLGAGSELVVCMADHAITVTLPDAAMADGGTYTIVCLPDGTNPSFPVTIQSAVEDQFEVTLPQAGYGVTVLAVGGSYIPLATIVNPAKFPAIAAL